MNQHRSYGRINWNSNRLGLILMSPSHRFFLYAEPLIAMALEPGVLKVVKRRNKRPEAAVGYHPGAIIGRLDRSEEWVRIRLYLGEAGQDIEMGEDGSLLHIVSQRDFVLPAEDLGDFLPSIKRMFRQRDDFNELSMLADTVPEWGRAKDVNIRNNDQTSGTV